MFDRARGANYHYFSTYGCQAIDQTFSLWTIYVDLCYILSTVYTLRSRSLEKYETCNIQPALHLKQAIGTYIYVLFYLYIRNQIPIGKIDPDYEI